MLKQLFKTRKLTTRHELQLFPTLNNLIQTKNNLNFLSQIGKKPENLLQNQNHSNRYGNGMEFAEVRHYQLGDEVRNIDWKVTARTNQPHTKLFIEEKDRNVYFCLDQSSHLNFGTAVCLKSYTLNKIGATLAWRYAQEQQKISGLFFKKKNDYFLLKPLGRNKGVMQLLQAFIDYQNHSFQFYNTQSCFIEKIYLPLTRTPPGSKIIILSDFAHSSKDSFKYIASLQKNRSVSCYHVYDPIEKNWPNENTRYCISNGNHAVSIEANKQFIKAYQDSFNQKINLLKKECHKINTEYTLIENNEFLYQTLLLN